MIEYLVVGLGLAGLSFCERLLARGRSFLVYSDGSQQASRVAGGLYNPVILKRFTLAWQADEQLQVALPFYKALAEKLGVDIDQKLPVYRRFASTEEQNAWFQAADDPRLEPFLLPMVHPNGNPSLDAPFGYGEVRHTGRIDTATLLTAYTDFLAERNLLRTEAFIHQNLKIGANHVTYNGIRAKHVVFCEGYGIKRNPFFNYLPLNGTKGELLTIKAPELREDNVIKSAVFIIPLKESLYLVGATYKWQDKTNVPTQAAKAELLKKLRSFLRCDFEVVGHVAGIRPTVTDRRPLVGTHPKFERLHVLNGMGSRGVLIAPTAADWLLRSIEDSEPLPTEVNIQRFASKYPKD